MMKKLLVGGLVALLVIVLLAAAGASADENLVKNGHLGMCPKHTVDQLIDGFIGSPQWASKAINDSKTAVAVRGNVQWQGKPAVMELQFLTDKSTGNFSYEGLIIDGEAQAKLIGNGIFLKMCAQAG